jgi:hypothetical protein
MALWPTSLPQTPLLGYSESGGSSTIRTTLDVGPAKTRRRYTAAPVNYAFSLHLSGAQLSILDTFYETTTGFGSVPFDWVEFRDTTTSASYRFLSRPVARALGNNQWRANISIEKML